MENRSAESPREVEGSRPQAEAVIPVEVKVLEEAAPEVEVRAVVVQVRAVPGTEDYQGEGSGPACWGDRMSNYTHTDRRGGRSPSTFRAGASQEASTC